MNQQTPNPFKRILVTLVIAAVIEVAAPGAASAIDPLGQRAMVGAGHPLAQKQIKTQKQQAQPVWRPTARGPHVFYGTIVAIRGTSLSVLLRNSRIVSVDVAAAVASGNYSAPLFVGKTVSVDGSGNGGAFTAAHVFRVTNLANLSNDR
jgi:hypothetical protein